MQNAQDNLGNHVLRSDEVDVVDAADLLQLDVPLAQLLGCQVLAIALMGNVMVLAKDAAEIAAGKEYRATSIVPLDAWFCDGWSVCGTLALGQLLPDLHRNEAQSH